MLTTLFQLLGVATVSGFLLLILKIQQKRELANRIARRYCNQNDLQFLDGTVAFRGCHFNWIQRRIVFRFHFDYSLNKTDRYTGSISLAGNRVPDIYADRNPVRL
ncbi:MAG: DUF3301 domain-containing protein [Gammaproteobacteria bacterium]|nr:DUF3301 domain-containing protein [Gammaproteobacteria bacterium]